MSLRRHGPRFSPLRPLFFALLVRPLVLLGFGLRVRDRARLPREGPALIVANHNSHLDVLVLTTLFPLRLLRWLRPVAAADFFGRTRLLAWFTRRVIGAILIDRSGAKRAADGSYDPLAAVAAALEAGDIVILFPEGTRGEPEQLGSFKRGVAHLAGRLPDVPVTPIFLHGLGKALPKNDWLPVPFVLDVLVGEPLRWNGDRDAFMAKLERAMNDLAEAGHFPPWL